MAIILTIIISFVTGFIIRGYIIDKNHNATLRNHSADVSRFLSETRELKKKISFLKKRNAKLEKRISALLFLTKKPSGKNTRPVTQTDLFASQKFNSGNRRV